MEVFRFAVDVGGIPPATQAAPRGEQLRPCGKDQRATSRRDLQSVVCVTLIARGRSRALELLPVVIGRVALAAADLVGRGLVR